MRGRTCIWGVPPQAPRGLPQAPRGVPQAPRGVPQAPPWGPPRGVWGGTPHELRTRHPLDFRRRGYEMRTYYRVTNEASPMTTKLSHSLAGLRKLVGIWLIWMLALPSALGQQPPPPQRPNPQRFEQEVSKLEEAAAADQFDVVFVGSSSIRLWNLKEYFPGVDLVNHGFGGSHIADSTHYAPRLIHRFHPRVVVFYAGDNDIAFGLSPQEVAEDYAEFSHRLHEALPECRVIYVSIKPSLARWQLFPRMKAANEKISKRMESDRRADFLDVGPPMLARMAHPAGNYSATMVFI